MVPGFEQSNLRLTPDGGLSSSWCSKSRSRLGNYISTDCKSGTEYRGKQNKVVHGDTAYTPYSTGTWGSRCIVMAGGAVSAASEFSKKDKENSCASSSGVP